MELLSAYLLVFHGSKDIRPNISVERLKNMIKEQVEISTKEKILIENACLELGEFPLHEQIKSMGDRALNLGYKELKIIPLFLLAGVHVMEDIPKEINLAQRSFGDELKIQLCPYLGSHERLIHILARKQLEYQAETWILIAHGSNRQGFKRVMELMGNRLNCVIAYWAIKPNLREQMIRLINQGYRNIGILPYFLFPGGITDAIASEVIKLKQEFPHIKVYMGETIGVNLAIAKLIWELTQ